MVKHLTVPGFMFSFVQKGENMRKVLFAVLSLSISSCGIQEIGEHLRDSNVGNVWGGPPKDNNAGTMRTACYMTALEYKKDYDWRSDQAVGSVRCSLAVYEDGSPIMKIPVGDTYEVGADPDMHRIIQGHLYTDYSTDTETVIKKDGQLLFRYAGREAICGMEVSGEDIYTLGQARNGNGFTFRRNGSTIIGREHGEIIGKLINDEDSLCFAFREQIQNADGHVGRYYIAVNGKVSQIAVRDDIQKIWDVHAGKDGAVYLASLTGLNAPVIFSENSMIYLSMPDNSSMVSCRLFKTENEIGVEGMYRFADGSGANAIWINGKTYTTFPKDRTISALEIYDDGVFCVMNPTETDNHSIICMAGETGDILEGYAVMGDDCIKMMDGILHIGLSSLNGERPVIWKDGSIDYLDINGYISAIYN